MNNDYDKMLAKGSEVKDELTEFIKKNPWAAVAIALGLGFLIAKLLGNRKE